MKNNYILVDYENVQNIDLSCIKDQNFYVKIFIGTHQTKIPIELVLKSQELGNHIEWIQINGSGKNALDFHITFILGRLTQKDPNGFFHIISKDTGFDPLIIYLKNQNIFCKRINDLSCITQAKFPISLQEKQKDTQKNIENNTEKIEQKSQIESGNICKLIVQKIGSIDKKCRPKSEVTLKNHIKSLLGLKELAPVIDEVYQELINSKKIYVNQSQKIEYRF